jgi:hypothetical protein
MLERTATKAHNSSDSAAWGVLALLTLGVAWCEWLRPLAVSPASLSGVGIACAALIGAALFYRSVRPRENFAVMCTALAQVILFSAVGIVLSYLLARGDGPLWDGEFRIWDGAIGFDWLSYVHWVDRSAALTGTLHVAYGSLIPQIIVLVLALGFSARIAELRSVMLAAIVCGTICILVSAFFPAISNPAMLGLTGSDFSHVDPWGGYVHLADLMALRDGSFAELRLGEMQGIITFPSYHAGLSLVTLWGFWVSRMAWLQWTGMTLAALTIAATPVDGGHYLVDVLAGLAIAGASIALAVRAVRWTPAWPRLMASPFRRSHAASGQ